MRGTIIGDPVVAQKAPMPVEVEEGKHNFGAHAGKVRNNHFAMAVTKTPE